MKARTGLLACLMVVLGEYIVLGRVMTRITGSPEVAITPPSADVPRELAAFSGVWQCNPEGSLPSRLIVEEIYPNWASIVYTWVDHPTEGLKAGWARVRAKVLPGGKLQWGFPGRFTVEMAQDGMSIEGKREQAGRQATFTLKKAGALVAD